MASEPNRAILERVGSRLVGLAARALEDPEREAVLGDLEEASVPGSRALCEIAGLVLRRQAALWTEWRPWVVLMGVIAPLGLFLSIVSRFTADGSSVYLWLYANNANWDLLHNRGFWYELGDTTIMLLAVYLKLACWSWIVGYVIGSASKRIAKISSLLFVAILFTGVFVAPVYFSHYWDLLRQVPGRPSLPPQNDPVGDVLFYRTMLPVIVQLFIVAVPAISAMRRSQTTEPISPTLRRVLIIAAVITVAHMLVQNLKVWSLWVMWNPHFREIARYAAHLRVMDVLSYWPVAYLLISSITHRLSRKAAVA
jgi:hypothetical protein